LAPDGDNAIIAIYNGTTTNWSQVGGPHLPITVISRVSSSSTRQVFERYVLDEPERLSLGPRYMEVDTTALVARTIAVIPGAIGYTDVGTATRQGLQTVLINNIEALPGNVVNNRYIFWAVEHMYTNGFFTSSALTLAFLQYMDGDIARAVESSFFLINFNDMTRDALAAHAF
jgi:phosphate transport system substrate-binding protein